MNLFVTGLCLQGNKGGPAIALALRGALEEQLGPLDITLSVPARDLARERVWAGRYGIKVVPDWGPRDVVPPFVFRHFPSKLRRVREWFAALLSADAVVEMSAISYVGPPLGSGQRALSSRFRYFMSALVLRRPFLAWTQSYGPFSTRAIRIAARLDLRRLPVIYCRGEDCRAEVERLLPGARTRVYPDVAVRLDYDLARGRQLLEELGVEPDRQRVVTISPSAVLYRRALGRGSDNEHVGTVARIVDWLLARDYRVVLVPHTTLPDHPDPAQCDLAVSRLVAEVVGRERVVVLESDLSPIDLKSIIANAEFHVGGRYHSIVAALSSMVPALSLSWHDKYEDIMRMYRAEEFVVDDAGDSGPEAISSLLTILTTRGGELRRQLAAAQAGVAREVTHNASEFAEDLRRLAG